LTGEALSTSRDHAASWRQDPRCVGMVRFALATTIAMTIAQAWSWPLSFIFPVFVLGILSERGPGPTLRETIESIGYALVAFSVTLVFVLLFLPFPISFMLAYVLAVFLMSYHLHKGAPFLLVLFMLVALILYPILGSLDEGLAKYIALSLTFSSVLALLVVQLAHGLLPDPPGGERVVAPAHQPGYSPEAARRALKTTIVIALAMAAFVAFKWASYVVVLIYIGIMALEGGLAEGKYNAKKYLVANAVGGLAALPFYAVMVVVPEIHFFVVLTLVTMLLFAFPIFSGSPTAKYYGSALSGLVILISSSLGPGADIDANVVNRVIFIILSGAYVIAAMSVLDRLLPESDEGQPAH